MAFRVAKVAESSRIALALASPWILPFDPEVLPFDPVPPATSSLPHEPSQGVCRGGLFGLGVAQARKRVETLARMMMTGGMEAGPQGLPVGTEVPK